MFQKYFMRYYRSSIMITVRRGGKIKMSKSVLTSVYAPMTGRVIPLSEVPDPVFSDKILGDGIAIIHQMVISTVL